MSVQQNMLLRAKCAKYYISKYCNIFARNYATKGNTDSSCCKEPAVSKGQTRGTDKNSSGGPNLKKFQVYRYGGALSKEKPKIETFEFDTKTCGPMVLDAMLKIKDIDSSFAFRRSCREGICGSCGINLQGKNCLACITEIPKDSVIRIYPLPHMYVIRDLVVDMTHFYKQYHSIRPYLVRESTTPGDQQYAQSLKDSEKMIGLYECVLCACCSTACPSYWWNNRKFLGPASLLHAYRWIIDSRDQDEAARLEFLKDDFKAFKCHSIFNCMVTCPKGLNPALQIAKLKKLLVGFSKKPKPEIDPLKYTSGSGSCGCK